MTDRLWQDSGGEGPRTILLLHGLGATAAVWSGVCRVLEQRRAGRWIAPDLSGHGGSRWLGSYSVGQLAAELVELVSGAQHIVVVGHSLGAYVGLALASRWFGVNVEAVLGVGPKISWPEADLQTARELAARPVRFHATEEEVLTRYRRVSGLSPEIAADASCLSRGVVRVVEGWRLTQDPRTFGAAGAPFSSLFSSAKAVVGLARGEHDSMVSTAELQMHSPRFVEEISCAGHNVHVEKPDRVVALLERLTESCPNTSKTR